MPFLPVVQPTERFSDRADAYARSRPGYPPAVLDVLRRECGFEPGWVVADVGSGTGLSSVLFLSNGNPVQAVEPNGAMRAAAEGWLGDRPGFRSVAGTAEATTLPSGSVDLVVCAQAFHWFDPAAARAEFARIQRPGGAVVLLWNRRRLDGTPFLRAYEALLERHGIDYERVRRDRLGGAAVAAFFGTTPKRAALPNEQWLDLEGLKGRLRSSSYLPGEGHPGHGAMVQAAERLFAGHAEGGRVRLEYELEIYMGTLAGPAPA
jgi:SAM-dependent methyltransferase